MKEKQEQMKLATGRLRLRRTLAFGSTVLAPPSAKFLPPPPPHHYRVEFLSGLSVHLVYNDHVDFPKFIWRTWLPIYLVSHLGYLCQISADERVARAITVNWGDKSKHRFSKSHAWEFLSLCGSHRECALFCWNTYFILQPSRRWGDGAVCTVTLNHILHVQSGLLSDLTLLVLRPKMPKATLFKGVPLSTKCRYLSQIHNLERNSIEKPYNVNSDLSRRYLLSSIISKLQVGFLFNIYFIFQYKLGEKHQNLILNASGKPNGSNTYMWDNDSVAW